VLNPTIDLEMIERARADDPAALKWPNLEPQARTDGSLRTTSNAAARVATRRLPALREPESSDIIKASIMGRMAD